MSILIGVLAFTAGVVALWVWQRAGEVAETRRRQMREIEYQSSRVPSLMQRVDALTNDVAHLQWKEKLRNEQTGQK